MRAETVRKALWVWESPVTGNAVVVMRELAAGAPGPRVVLVGDLDMGETYLVRLDDLRRRFRPAEPEDFEFSWTMDCDEEVRVAVEDPEWYRVHELERDGSDPYVRTVRVEVTPVDRPDWLTVDDAVDS
jgi:hypothetical protein